MRRYIIAMMTTALIFSACGGGSKPETTAAPEKTTAAPETTTAAPTTAAETQPAGPLQVEMDTTASWDGNKIIFDTATNLPDGTKFTVSVDSGDFNAGTSFSASGKVEVSGGHAISEGFSNKGAKLSGTYDLSITMTSPKQQPDTVKAIIGDNGELLEGDCVTESTILPGVFSAERMYALTIDGDTITLEPEGDYQSTTFSEEEPEEKEETPAETEAKPQPTQAAKDPTEDIKMDLRGFIHKYADTDIDDITLNPNLGTDKDGDYIALVRLTWNVKNSGNTSKQMVDMYSQDLAVQVYDNIPEIQEIAIFWTVPYLNGTAKESFERASGGMKFTDKVFSW